MKQRAQAADSLAERFALPAEALGKGRITLVGKEKALIENQRGILEYGPELIRVAVRGNCLSLRGSDLRLGAMNPRELLILGTIQSVEWEG